MRVSTQVGVPGAGTPEPGKGNDAAAGAAQARPADVSAPATPPSTTTSDNRDVVELSDQAQALLASGGKTDPLQAEMVARARKFIEAGLYNDQGVLETTADRLSLVISADA